MTTHTTTARDDAAVAAYASLEGAERAVAHLVSLGYDEHDVGIGPRDFDVVDQHPLRRSLGRGARWGAAGGLVLTTGFAVGQELGWSTIVDSILPTIATGLLAGLLAGLVLAVVAYRRKRAKEFLAAPKPIAPTRFEVVVDRDRDRARHGLARWWDPEAAPAGWQQPA